MNLKELNVPIIVYWDIVPQFPVNPDIIQRICVDLLSNRVFVLNIWDSSPDMCAKTATILERLRNENIDIALTVNYSALNIVLDFKNFMPALKKILIQFESFDQFASTIDKIQLNETDTPPVGISFVLSETNFKDIPDVLKLCIKAGTKNINFPIPRPAENQKIFWLDTEKEHWLLEEIKYLQIDDLNITIHDPFLWKIFNKRVNQNEKGCQGGNTMVYISGNLEVTPCPLLPIVLGNLQSTTLTKLFFSPERHRIRRQLSTPPHECGNCDKLNDCGGGCRGRAYLTYKTFDKRDPSCYCLISR